MKFFFMAVLVLSMVNGQAQEGSKNTPSNSDSEASFPGGKPAWIQFLNKNLHYPDEAVNNEIKGDILVQFDVDEQGNVSNITAIKGPKKGGLREEAIRIIQLSGKWVPAMKNNVAVKSTGKETISFKLSAG